MAKTVVVFGLLLVLTSVLAWWQWPEMLVEVNVCDVGQGDGIVITQGFSQMVIDVGRNDGAMVRCLGEVLPFWDRRLEMVVITHGDSDHSGGLTQVAAAYEIEKLVTSEKAVKEISELVPELGAINPVWLGQRWVWGLVETKVVWPPELSSLSRKMAASTNDTGLVLRLEFENNNSMWLAADVGAEVEKLMMEMGLVESTKVLKVSHHGSRSATTEPFLRILQPQYFLISVGKNNYGHPSNEVMNLIERVGGRISRTDTEGRLTIPNGGM